MNDFTKEELQIILLDMDTYIERSKPLRESPCHNKLREKVKFMIDTYCGHEQLKDVGAEYLSCRMCGEEVYLNE